ncbi:MAG: response regulator, partial [Blautia faecis]
DPGFLKGRRIMLVEDNELNREIAYELLSESGLIVDVAENGQEAIKLLGIRPENYYELIFMDIQMPVMNGYEATANIRAGESDYWKTIPVIAMTANVFQEDESRAAECGMSDYVTKPIDMNVIYSVLEKWLLGQKG